MDRSSTSIPDVAFRPSLLSHIGNIICAIVFVVLGLPLAVKISDIIGKNITFPIWGIFSIIGVLFLLKAAWKSYNQRLCLCNQYVSAYAGILSPSMRTTRLLYEHVRGVEIEQSLFQRCVNLGDLHVGSDVNKGEGEMVVCGIRNPDRVKDLLLQRVRLTAHPS